MRRPADRRAGRTSDILSCHSIHRFISFLLSARRCTLGRGPAAFAYVGEPFLSQLFDTWSAIPLQQSERNSTEALGVGDCSWGSSQPRQARAARSLTARHATCCARSGRSADATPLLSADMRRACLSNSSAILKMRSFPSGSFVRCATARVSRARRCQYSGASTLLMGPTCGRPEMTTPAGMWG